MAAVELGSPRFPLHPLHGVHDPSSGTPARRRGSVRRTTSIDMTRADGSSDPLFLNGIGRDLLTAHDGSATELGRARFGATIDMAPRVIRHLDTMPEIDGVSGLLGGPAMSGFRAAVDTIAPHLRQRRDLLYTLLDDVPVTTLISGHALSASGLRSAEARLEYRPVADQCAGFVTDGLLMSSYRAGDPAVVTGPVAPRLEDPDDPSGWHSVAALPVHGMRRRRRIDVGERDDDGMVHVDAMFRDTYVRGDARETVIHEYTFAGTVDIDSGVIRSAEVVPRVLPWQECPAAADSARRIVGMALDELHSRVRHELVGTSTCTHLNDLLRSLGDARALIAKLPG